MMYNVSGMYFYTNCKRSAGCTFGGVLRQRGRIIDLRTVFQSVCCSSLILVYIRFST